ncbi:rCG33014 [Rattus norvegicus]|uniref:RCG33014 n=1 Tax=Rattus norvegicus TaxID=10116 RepID=A6HH69_RAT|nr:rCG33014 [Rattus norvegicus]
MVAVENPADVRVVSSRNSGPPPLLYFVVVDGATPIAGCFMPGTFTNRLKQPWIVVVTDPRADHQPSQRRLMTTCPLLLCVSHTLFCTTWTWPSHATT